MKLKQFNKWVASGTSIYNQKKEVREQIIRELWQLHREHPRSGIWHYERDLDGYYILSGNYSCPVVKNIKLEEDASFIADACTALPMLVDMIQRLLTERDSEAGW